MIFISRNEFTTFLYIFLGVWLLSFEPGLSQTSNLVKNPSFERGLEGWSKVWYKQKSIISQETAHSGERSLQMDLTGSSTIQVRVVQKIDVRPDTLYRLSLNAHTTQRSGGGRQLVGLHGSKSASLVTDLKRAIEIPNGVGWTEYKEFFYSGDHTEMYVLLGGRDLDGRGSGRLFMDDIRVVMDQSPDPGWVQQYRSERMPQWEEWHNSLQPEGSSTARVELAAEGSTDYVIVIPEQPSKQERRAAGELQLWLGEITGAKFPIVSDSEPETAREISVGRTNRMEDLKLEETGEADADGCIKQGGYTIEVRDQRIYALGHGPMGPLPAVFALLEEDLGVRWYGPNLRRGSWDEHTQELRNSPWKRGDYRVPDRPTLEPELTPRTRKPAFPIRRLTWYRAYNPWGLRNRINGSYANEYGQTDYVNGSLRVHTFYRLVPPDVHFEEHPEYYSLVDGKRRKEEAQLCLTEREVARIAASTAIDALEKSPDNRCLIGISPEDHKGNCECEDCQRAEHRKGGYSGLLLDFVNRVAERVQKDVPDAIITTLAYRQSKQPPAVQTSARENVAIQFCSDFGANFTWPYHSFDDRRLAKQRGYYRRWKDISGRPMHLWLYPHQYRHRLAPMPTLRRVARNLRFFREEGAEYAYMQHSLGNARGREAMRFWVYSKLMWNPDLDVEKLMLDFFWGYYGDAAPQVLRFNKLLWDQSVKYTRFNRPRNWIYPIHDEEMYRHGFIEKARRILGRALNAAENNRIRKRVELLRAGVVYVDAVQLYMQMCSGKSPDAEHYADVARELVQLCDRLDIQNVGFYDGEKTLETVEEFVEEMDRKYDGEIRADEDEEE